MSYTVYTVFIIIILNNSVLCICKIKSLYADVFKLHMFLIHVLYHCNTAHTSSECISNKVYLS